MGHIQRGGTAVPSDRILGTILGNKCVEHLLEGEVNKMVGLIDNKTSIKPINEILKNKRGIDKDLYEISKVISNYWIF